MTKFQAETLEQIVEFYRYYVRDDAMRASLHVQGIGDEMIDEALDALKTEACRAPSQNSPQPCVGCRVALPCVCPAPPRPR